MLDWNEAGHSVPDTGIDEGNVIESCEGQARVVSAISSGVYQKFYLAVESDASARSRISEKSPISVRPRISVAALRCVVEPLVYSASPSAKARSSGHWAPAAMNSCN